MKQYFLRMCRQGRTRDVSFLRLFLFLHKTRNLLFSQKLLRLQLVTVLTLILMSGCASDPKKLSPVATEVKQIKKTLAKLIQAYEKRNKDDFLEKLDPSSGLRRSLEERIAEDFSGFSEAKLSIAIERIEIEEKMLLTALQWKGVWMTHSAASPFEKRGKALFLWSPRKDSKLVEIRGDSPFASFSK